MNERGIDYRSIYRILAIMVLVLCALSSRGQENTTLRSKTIPWIAEGVQLDSMVIVPESIVLTSGDSISVTDWRLDDRGWLFPETGQVQYDSLKVVYRAIPIPYEVVLQNKDTNLIRSQFEYTDPFAYTPSSRSDRSSLFQLDGFEKSGSIARGVQVGNAQDLSVSSDLNLQLSGKLTDKISILANISDDNIPIQADGSTQQLQEFDKVFIKLYGKDASLTAGDYQVRSQRGYFSRYLKKARGGLFESNVNLNGRKDSLSRIGFRAGAAVSRGRFARNVVQGVEGNQGPYKLRGANNELFIIILSGTERVFIDGRLLKRGKEYDYTIDYNSAEVTFTANRMITKDRRIVVEFQYAEQSYARSLLQFGAGMKMDRWEAFLDVYSEQDGKNKPLQQDLDENDRILLNSIGDDLGSAFASGTDTVPFAEDLVLYTLVDSLGYDSVFVFSDDPEKADYEVSFTRVGMGLGDYIQSDFNSNGRIYTWVAPDTVNGILLRNGDHVPGVLLVTPKELQVINAGLRYSWKSQSWIEMEGALSNEDLNTFSKKDRSDDIGLAGRLRAAHRVELDSGSYLKMAALMEYTDEYFRPIERYRSVEFERNWNASIEDLRADQLQTRFDVGFEKDKRRSIGYTIDRFATMSDFSGLRHEVSGRWDEGRLKLDIKGSLLDTEGELNSRFERHRADVSYNLGRVRIGFRDEREDNRFSASSDTLSTNSYRFYDWETYLTSGDTSSWNYRLFYRNRDDWRPSDDLLLRAAHAEEYGLELHNAQTARHHVNLVGSWRSLELVRDELIDNEADDTFVGRLEHRGKWAKGTVSSSTFYEVGSGLERRKQFVYIEVPAGQGVYVWVDYNGDEVRDLDEFEVAQFQYEANFIRVFTPTDLFEKTFTNQISQNIAWDMGKLWRSEKGWKGFVARFSDQSSWRADRKTREKSGSDAYNPFIQNLEDSVLLSLNNSLRNSFFFNRTSPIWSLDHVYSDIKGKQLLTNGFESRSSVEHKLNGRYTYERRYTMRLALVRAETSREASYSSNRDYSILEEAFRPSLEWQPDRTIRTTVKGELSNKENSIGDGEKAEIRKLGVETRFNQMDKGSVNLGFDYVLIEYSGDENTSLAFEMLDGLRTGNNFTWTLFLQRNLAKNLEMNITYNGRKSETNKAIHAGGVQVRAFF